MDIGKAVTVAKQIVVIGRSRSGTSLIAGILHHLGVYMHHKNIEHESNPRGAFEDPQWMKIANNMILAMQTGDAELMQKYIGIAGQTAREYDTDSELWGFKAANISVCLEHIMPAFAYPVLIYVFRNPLTTAYSDVKFTHTSSDLELTETLKEIKLANAMRQTGDFLHACQRHMDAYRKHPHCYLEFESIRKDPERGINTIISTIGHMPTAEQIAAALQFVSPDQCTWKGI